MTCWTGFSASFVLANEIGSASRRGQSPSRRGEGGEEWLGKKDTGYLYKAFMVARRPLMDVDP
jgi:hypothetical protein